MIFLLVTLAPEFSLAAVGQQQNDLIEKQQERDKLKRYLAKHQLHELYTDLLEQELETVKESDGRLQLATELARHYAWQLNSRPGRFVDADARLDALSLEFPDAIPLQTRINIGYGRYRKAKDAFEQWNWQRDAPQLRQKAESGFVNVIQRSTDALARTNERLAVANLSVAERKELETARSQFSYLAAWARYYRGIAMDESESKNKLLTTAETGFLELLQVNDSDMVVELSPQWWPLDSEWTCRLLLGLAMTSQAQEKNRQAEHCFNLLTEARVPASIRDSQRVWRFNSFVFAGQLPDAEIMVKKWETNRLAFGDVAFWSSVTVAGLGSSLAESTLMTRAGLTGLAKANEFKLIDEVLERFDHAAEEIPGGEFFADWMRGYALLKRATSESGGGPVGAARLKMLSRAKTSLVQALNSTSIVDPVYRARCRYHFGFAAYYIRDFKEAAEQFSRASTVLSTLDKALAEHAAWMQCQSIHRIVSNNNYWGNSLAFALDEFQRRFPDSPNVQEAAFMRVMNQLESQPGIQAIKTLQSIPVSDPNFPKALFEICRIGHRLWAKTTEMDKKNRHAAMLLNASRDYEEIAGQGSAPIGNQTRLARIYLFAVDVLVHQRDLVKAQEWMTRCNDLSAIIQTEHELDCDYHFLQLNMAALQGNLEQERIAGEWLLANASRRLHTRSAMVSRARLLDQTLMSEITTLANPNSDRRYDEVIDAYLRIIDEFRSDNETYWAEDPTARTALFRLAELQVLRGNLQDAKTSFTALRQVAPTELRYLLGLARVEMQLKQFADAAFLWRQVAAGLPVGHDAWLESKHGLIVCLIETRPTAAGSVLEQTLLLVPNMSGEWQTQFDILQSRIDLSVTTSSEQKDRNTTGKRN